MMNRKNDVHSLGNMLQYKGYSAIPEYSSEDRCFHGKLLGIQDCILFEGQSVKELEKAFKDSVDEYLEQCASEGIEPRRPYSGKFNLRMPPELHARVTQAAVRTGKSVNQFIVDSVSLSIEK